MLEPSPSYSRKPQHEMSYVGFEVFTAVVMKSIIFWDMTPCNPLSFNRRFGRTYRLHLQGQRNRFSKTSKQAGATCLLAGLLQLNGLYGVLSQKMIFFWNIIDSYSHIFRNVSLFIFVSIGPDWETEERSSEKCLEGTKLLTYRCSRTDF
jgi:hypothetical protein